MHNFLFYKITAYPANHATPLCVNRMGIIAYLRVAVIVRCRVGAAIYRALRNTIKQRIVILNAVKNLRPEWHGAYRF
jgi:hypothetical protein